MQRPAFVLVAALLASCSFVGCSSGNNAKSCVDNCRAPTTIPPPSTFDASSTAFAPGGPIPKQYTCDGASLSPPLRWDNAPANTAQVALIVDDPDAPGGTFVHWVAWGLRPDGAIGPGTVPAGAVQGSNGAGRLGYTGPCPPNGLHHYHFTFYALSKAPAVQPGATADQLRHAIETTTLAATSFVSTYKRG